ncbi:MAG: hypothetical protein IJ860_10160 [Eubacterium sp.]|nr:hypothetical protein [Eubacterium sp.]
MRTFLKTLLAVLIFAAACANPYAISAAPGFEQVASGNELANAKKVSRYGMLPVYARDIADGVYDVKVASSSSFFRIAEASLLVENGSMQLTMLIPSKSYTHVYPGSGTEAAAAPLESYIAAEEAERGTSFTVPVEALDQAFSCATFSKNRKKWYDRALLIEADSLPAEALKVSLPDYDLISDALDAYAETHPDEVAEAKDEGSRAGAPAGEETSGQPGASPETGAAGQEEARTKNHTGSAGQEGTSSGAESDSAAGSAGRDTEDAAEADAGSDTPAAGTSGQTGNQETGGSEAGGSEAVSVNLPDGEYAIEVTMTGGSGRASVSSPTWLVVENGRAYARLLWSSSYYDYMVVEDTIYRNLSSEGGNSTFLIPLTEFDEPMAVIADTTAMGDPVEIEYMLTFYEDSIGNKGQIPQEAAKKVLITALVIIVAGGVLNYLVKARRKR